MAKQSNHQCSALSHRQVEGKPGWEWPKVRCRNRAAATHFANLGAHVYRLCGVHPNSEDFEWEPVRLDRLTLHELDLFLTYLENLAVELTSKIAELNGIYDVVRLRINQSLIRQGELQLQEKERAAK